MLALAGLRRAHQRGGDRLRRRHGGQLVGQHGADEARALLVGAGLHRRQAGEGLHDRIVDRLLRVGPLLAEAVDRDVDDVGRHRADRRLVDAEPLDHAGPEVLHQHVGAGGQPLHAARHPAGVFRSMATERLLRLRFRNEAEKPFLPVAVGARVVALARLLDLDHVGALVGQDHGGPGPRQHRGQVDDANSFERSHVTLRALAGRAHASCNLQYQHIVTLSNRGMPPA